MYLAEIKTIMNMPLLWELQLKGSPLYDTIILMLPSIPMILNNRLPNFGSYKSLYTLVMASRDPAIVRRGASVHVPVNFIMAFTGFNYFSSINYYTYIA